jgi:leucyl-tRNA synthetase
MYPNGPAHIGHARTYLIADILARYKRMRGYNVLFPMGFHYTGTPILAMAESIASGDDEYIKRLSSMFGIDEETVSSLRDPLTLARYFHEVSKVAMKFYGLGIDWRREFTSIDPEFSAFIRWQFEKLRKKGYMEKGSHPVGWCPYHQMPVGMHDTKDDVEPEIDEVVIIKFVDDEGLVFPAATLRPETLLGVTNVWINPEVTYCITEVESGKGMEKWVLSCEAAHKLSYQRNVKIVDKVKGSEFVGKKLKNPLTGKIVMIIEATFVDPRFGTGVVMSVPAHAPYDYAALRDYINKRCGRQWIDELKPIPLIKVKGYSDVPAKDVVELLGVRNQNDTELLEKATKEVYRTEYEAGVMREDVVDLVVDEVIPNSKEFVAKYVAGKPTSEARSRIEDFLIKNRYGDKIFEVMNAPVYCRCGTEIVVKIVRNQWFINYGDSHWKKLAKEALSQMKIVPEEARRQFEATIDWLRRKACVRSRGLGTELPWEKGWVIESLSDSTIYMAFYTVIHKIREAGIPAEKLNEEFWDYVMLGEGDVKTLSKELEISEEVLTNLREEFMYWYPLDSRNSGKDLIPNHLTFFIFNHVAVFPRDLWPKMIVANGWVVIRGEKMSKSKGNIETMMGLIDSFSPDVIRMTISTEAEVEQDMNFTYEKAEAATYKLREIEELIKKVYFEAKSDSYDIPERWLISILGKHVSEFIEGLDNVRVRSAGVRVFYLMLQDLKTYLNMVERPSKVVRNYIKTWIKLMAPYTPHFAEELWHNIGMKNLVVAEKIPPPEVFKRDYEAELMIRYMNKVIEDIRDIMKVVKGSEAMIYVVPKQEYEELLNVLKILKSGGKLGEVIKDYITRHPDVPKKSAVKLAKQLYDIAINMDDESKKLILQTGGVDEFKTLNIFKEYLVKTLGLKTVKIFSTLEPVPDIGGKKSSALPWRPGIYIR